MELDAQSGLLGGMQGYKGEPQKSVPPFLPPLYAAVVFSGEQGCSN